MSDTVTIQNKTIKLFKRNCLEPCDKVGKDKLNPFIDITVQLTNACNAECEFCCNAGKLEFIFDFGLFKAFFDEAYGKVLINKVTFTGGEPTLKIGKLNQCLDYIQGKCRLITVNTNGTRLELLSHPAIHRIALSRHHYLNEVNNSIFGITIDNPLETSLLKNKIAVVCNLIKGYVDCTAEAYKMLNFVAENGIDDMSFVGLMPIDKWCQGHQVPLDVLAFNHDVLCTKNLCYEVKGVCECSNHVYAAPNGRLVHYYMRHNKMPKFDKGSRVVWENNEIRK